MLFRSAGILIAIDVVDVVRGDVGDIVGTGELVVVDDGDNADVDGDAVVAVERVVEHAVGDDVVAVRGDVGNIVRVAVLDPKPAQPRVPAPPVPLPLPSYPSNFSTSSTPIPSHSPTSIFVPEFFEPSLLSRDRGGFEGENAAWEHVLLGDESRWRLYYCSQIQALEFRNRPKDTRLSSLLDPLGVGSSSNQMQP